MAVVPAKMPERSSATVWPVSVASEPSAGLCPSVMLKKASRPAPMVWTRVWPDESSSDASKASLIVPTELVSNDRLAYVKLSDVAPAGITNVRSRATWNESPSRSTTRSP